MIVYDSISTVETLLATQVLARCCHFAYNTTLLSIVLNNGPPNFNLKACNSVCRVSLHPSSLRQMKLCPPSVLPPPSLILNQILTLFGTPQAPTSMSSIYTKILMMMPSPTFSTMSLIKISMVPQCRHLHHQYPVS